ncbi:hypothetical protein [Streptomyces sp. NPDC005078]|uniref:hypothetical protein n=1 Tax=unclassified Streptomyces TaxID=2593676 RepID=UPI0033BD1E06
MGDYASGEASETEKRPVTGALGEPGDSRAVGTAASSPHVIRRLEVPQATVTCLEPLA